VLAGFGEHLSLEHQIEKKKKKKKLKYIGACDTIVGKRIRKS